jgi:hypothetical protein
MAVDTKEKRMNAAAVGRAWLRTKLATGTFDEQARINCGLGYGGNALSYTPPVVQGGLLHCVLYVRASLDASLYARATLEGVIQ